MPMIAESNARQQTLGLWSNRPGVMLYLLNNLPSLYESTVQSGSLSFSESHEISRIIQNDRNDFSEAPAQAWEATHVQNGQHATLDADGDSHIYRVRLATSGSEAVCGRRIVQVRGSGSEGSTWKSFGFITRSGRLRLWSSMRDDALRSYVRAAASYFDGSARNTSTPAHRGCWLCNHGSMLESHGLCAGHVERLPNPREDDDDDDDEDEEPQDYDEPAYNPPSRARTTRASTTRTPRPPVVRAARSPLYADYWQ